LTAASSRSARIPPRPISAARMRNFATRRSNRFNFQTAALGPSLRAQAKQSIGQQKSWIASSRSLSSGAHSRDPLAPLRKRFAFVAGNDERHPWSARIEFQTAMTTHNTASRSRRAFARVLACSFRPLQSEGAGNAGRPMRPIAACAMVESKKHTR